MEPPADGQPHEPPPPPPVPKAGDDGKIAEYLVKWCALPLPPRSTPSPAARPPAALLPRLPACSSSRCTAAVRHPSESTPLAVSAREHYAHVHCEWVAESLLESIAPRKLKNYIEKKGAPASRGRSSTLP